MTDASLDDFFAKKDKNKKSRSKGKYTTSELITKKFEESGRKCAQNDQTSSSNNTQGSQGSVSHTREDDDEWNDFELEKEKDYSGLRIQSLCIADREKEEDLSKDQQPQENGEDNKMSEANVGPWKMSGATAAPAPMIQDLELVDKVEESPVEMFEEVTKQAYRPPAMRYAQSVGGGGSGGNRGGRHGRNVPEMDSELHFPSLSQAAEPSKGSRASDASFQSVKHGLRSKEDTLHQGVRLDLGNKYSALDTN